MNTSPFSFDHHPELASESPNRYLARSLYSVRRERDRKFGKGLFSDVGWDIALLLFANGPEATVVAKSQISDELGTSENTVDRYVDALEGQGLVKQEAAFSTLELLALRLTDKAISFMEATFAAHEKHFVPLPSDSVDKS